MFIVNMDPANHDVNCLPGCLDGIAEVLVKGRDVHGGEVGGEVLPRLHGGWVWMNDEREME
jgi:hypothetical protein